MLFPVQGKRIRQVQRRAALPANPPGAIVRINWRTTLLVSLGFAGFSFVWMPYNLFIPIFLQAGSPSFNALHEQSILGFGLSAGTTGIFMTLDNVAALFVAPLVGLWSDRIRTRLGRRTPFLIATLPLITIGFLLLPFSTLSIDPATNGQAAANQGAFVGFLLILGLVLLGASVFRTPARALMSDLTPSSQRSQVNGIGEFLSGLTTVFIALVVARLFDVAVWWPFVISGLGFGLSALGMVLGLWRDDEAAMHEAVEAEEAAGDMIRKLNIVPKASRNSLIALLIAVFGFTFGYNAIESFYSSYAVAVLGVSAGQGAQMFAAALVVFLISAIPAGEIGSRFGRRNSMILGCALFGGILFSVYTIPGLTLNGWLLGLGGFAWALVTVNGLPMVVDSAEDSRLIGTYTGLFYLATQAASIASPILTGLVIDWMGRDYNALFIVTPVFFSIAIGALIFVTSGEGHPGDGGSRIEEPGPLRRLLPGLIPLE